MMAWGKWKSPKTAQRYYEDAPVTKDVHESHLSFDTRIIQIIHIFSCIFNIVTL